MSKCKCVCCDHDDEKPQWKYMKSELREKNKMSQMQDALKVLEKLKQENARLRELIEYLKTGDCWCQKGIGNPMIKTHSEVCCQIKKAKESIK